MRRVVVIPSLKPDGRLVSYALALRERGFDQVVVVDDGSGAAYAPIFEAAARISGVTLLRHEVNRGKGAALKTAFAYLKENSLDDWTYNKALQKIVESYRVSPETKARIRAMKRKTGGRQRGSVK